MFWGLTRIIHIFKYYVTPVRWWCTDALFQCRCIGIGTRYQSPTIPYICVIERFASRLRDSIDRQIMSITEKGVLKTKNRGLGCFSSDMWEGAIFILEFCFKQSVCDINLVPILRDHKYKKMGYRWGRRNSRRGLTMFPKQRRLYMGHREAHKRGKWFFTTKTHWRLDGKHVFEPGYHGTGSARRARVARRGSESRIWRV